MPDRDAWNRRYAERDSVWGAAPNRFVAEAFSDAAPRGRALDLAAGEGRNAVWLAERGWAVTAVDFSSVALERAAATARARGVELELIEADVTDWEPPRGAFQLVVVAYLQLPRPELRRALAAAGRALAGDGELFAVGHAVRNLAEGTGGPQDATRLWDAEALAEDLRALGLAVSSAEQVRRPVEGAERDAIDVRVRARRD